MTLRPYTVVLWTLGFLVLGEFALEVRAWRRGYETLLFGPPKTAVTTPDSEFGRTPAFPFRSRIVTPERRPGVPRIWIGSASFAEDIFVEPGSIWPTQLEDELERRGLEVEVLNASLGGVGIPHATRELAELGPTWQPDLVLLYHLPNDIDRLATALIGTPRSGEESGGFQVVGIGTGVEQGADDRPWATRLALRTTAFEQAVNVIGTRVEAVRPKADAPPEGMFEAIDATVREFLAVTEALGAQPVIATVPLSHPDPDDPPPAGYQRLLARTNGLLSTVGWQRAMAEGNASLRDLAAEERVDLLDTAELAGGRHELFDDCFHYTDLGHAELGRLVADQLEPLVRSLAAEAGR